MNSGGIKAFKNDSCTIWWGDALKVLEENIPDASVDLIFADPPYNIGKRFHDFVDRWTSDEEYAEWCAQWLDLCIEKLSPKGTLYVMSSTQCLPYLDIYLRKKMTIMSRIIWHYDSSGVQAKKYYGSMYEPILMAVKDPSAYTFNADAILVEAKTGSTRKLIDYRKPVPTVYNSKKVPGNVWYYPRVRYRMDEYENHPTQKPEALLERIILASSNPGDTVLDPFSGTFTTSKVACALGRTTIGIESQKEYVKIGIRRLGIDTEFDGETLTRPEKSFRKKSKVAAAADSK